jgi:hypothetical protein
MGSSSYRTRSFVTVPAFEELVMNWEVRNFRKILDGSNLTDASLVQEVSMEFEAGHSVNMKKN